MRAQKAKPDLRESKKEEEHEAPHNKMPLHLDRILESLRAIDGPGRPSEGVRGNPSPSNTAIQSSLARFKHVQASQGSHQPGTPVKHEENFNALVNVKKRMERDEKNITRPRLTHQDEKLKPPFAFYSPMAASSSKYSKPK